MRHPCTVRQAFVSPLALPCLVLAMMAACLWPFEFQPRNQVTPVPGETMLRFRELGSAYSREPFPPLHRIAERGELTIDITLRPRRLIGRYLPFILSFSPEQGQPALIVGAWKKALVLRLGRLGRPEKPTGRSYREIGVDNVFAPGEVVHLTICLGPRGTSIYTDGRLRLSNPAAQLEAPDVALGRLLLGNSPTGGAQWEGDILSLAIFDGFIGPTALGNGDRTDGSSPLHEPKALARYAFDQGAGKIVSDVAGLGHDLVIPATFAPLRRSVLVPPREVAKFTLSTALDNALNILGFMPFGYLLALNLSIKTALPRRGIPLIVVLAGFCFSLAIELTQVFLPARTSSFTDLCTNTVGATLGVLVFFAHRIPYDKSLLMEVS